MKKLKILILLTLFISRINLPLHAEETIYDDITPSFNLISNSDDNLYVKIYNAWAQQYADYFNGTINLNELQENLNEKVAPYIDTPEEYERFENSEKSFKNSKSYSYYEDWFHQTTTEISLCTFNANKCTKAYKLSKQAAEHAQSRYSDYTLWQGNGDAFRHAYWSALMTKYIDRDFAYEMGLAHEGLKKGYDWDSLNSDTKMDVSNNYYGRKRATALDGYTDTKIANNIAYHVTEGDLKRIRLYTSQQKYCDSVYQGVCTNYVGYYKPTSDGGRQF